MKISRKELESLSTDELLVIQREAQKVKEAAKFKTLESYHLTAHEDQIDFHKAGAKFRIRYFAGGNRSGKTTAGTVEDAWLSTGAHPFIKNLRTPNKGIIIIQDFENHGKNILEPKIMEWFPKGSIENIDRNQTGAIRKIFMKCGSTIDVCSHDQDMKVFEGGDYDWAHFDEPPPKKIFTAVWRGMTDRGGRMHLTATPLASPWMFKEYKKAQKGDPLRWFRFISTKKNAKNIGEGDESLGLKRIEEFAALLDESEKGARLNGECAQMQGQIFPDFDEEHHMIRPFAIPAHWKIWETIDPHAQKPWAVSYIAITDMGQKILLRCNKQLSGNIEQIANQILFERSLIKVRGNNRPRIVRCIIDNYASVPTWQKSNTDPTIERISVREELESYIGPRIGGPPIEVAPKNVEQKILLFKGWLTITVGADGSKASNFYAFDIPENEAFKDEIENYVWDATKDRTLKSTPKKENDEVLDTVMQVALCLPKEVEDEEPTPKRIMEPKSWTVR